MAKRIEEDNICPISLEEIKENEYYMTCRRCNKHFKLEPLKRWLEDNNSCPLCRSGWLNNENPRFKVYKNCEPKKYTLETVRDIVNARMRAKTAGVDEKLGVGTGTSSDIEIFNPVIAALNPIIAGLGDAGDD